MNPEIGALLTEVIEKVGLLRRDMQQRKELEKYEARFARIDQKFSALAERIARDDPWQDQCTASAGIPQTGSLCDIQLQLIQ